LATLSECVPTTPRNPRDHARRGFEAGRLAALVDHRVVLLRTLPLAPVLGALALAVAVHTATVRTAGPGATTAVPVVGVVVRDVRFTRMTGDPTRAASVTFAVGTLDGAQDVEVEAGGQRAVCVVETGKARCPLEPPVPLRAIEGLRVTAT
jgi:hypothetical protein